MVVVLVYALALARVEETVIEEGPEVGKVVDMAGVGQLSIPFPSGELSTVSPNWAHPMRTASTRVVVVPPSVHALRARVVVAPSSHMPVAAAAPHDPASLSSPGAPAVSPLVLAATKTKKHSH